MFSLTFQHVHRNRLSLSYPQNKAYWLGAGSAAPAFVGFWPPTCSTDIPAAPCVRNPNNGARVYFLARNEGGGTWERSMRNPGAIPDEMDYWIRRHAIQVSSATHPAQHQRMFNPARDRMVGLSAIGQSLKDHYYDAFAPPPMPPHLAALVEQLKMQK